MGLFVYFAFHHRVYKRFQKMKKVDTDLDTYSNEVIHMDDIIKGVPELEVLFLW